MRVDKLILTGVMAGIYSGILDGLEQEYGLNYIASALIITILTITTGYLLHKVRRKEMIS
ncbi:MAG: hypothetical protein ACQEXB_10745 [Bacillota bacterium]